MRNFIIRALTGIVYVALLVGCTVWSPVTAFFFFALVAASCVGEFCMLVNRHAGASVVISLNVLAAFLLVASVWLYCIGSPTTGQSLALYVLLVIYLLVSELYRGSDNPLRNWALSLFSHVYAAVPFALLPMLSVRYDAAASSYAYTWQYPLALFVFLWANDTGAYLFGVTLGRYIPAKLFPRISPKKSWVGSVGGGLLTLAVSRNMLASVSRHAAPMAMDGLCARRGHLRHLGRPRGEPLQAPAWHQGQRPHPARPWRPARPLR